MWLYVSRKDSSEDFLIGWRDRKWWQIMLSKFAWSIWAAWFITYTAYAYEFGFGVFAAVLGFTLGFIVFALWAVPIIYKESWPMSFYTQWDFVEHQTKSHVAKLVTNGVASLIQFSWLIIWITWWSKIISHFWLMSYGSAMILTVTIVTIYILLAWFKAVIITDVFQSIIILLLLVFLSFHIIGDTSVVEILQTQTWTLDWGTMIGFLLYWVLATFSLSDRYQLCYAADNLKTLQKGLLWAIIPVMFVSSFLLVIGLFMYTQDPTLDPGLVFIEALKTYVPPAFLSVSVVLFFAWLMSSSDTSIYAITSHCVLSKKSSKNPLKEIRLMTVLLLAVVCLFSYFYRDIVGITIIAAWITVSMSIPMIYILLWYKSADRFLWSIVWSFSGLIIGLLITWIYPVTVIYVVSWWLIGLLFKRSKKKLIDVWP